MRALGKEVIEELIMNLKDAGFDEELITKCIKKYNNDDLKMLINPSLEVITIFFRTTFKPFLSICRFYRFFLYF